MVSKFTTPLIALLLFFSSNVLAQKGSDAIGSVHLTKNFSNNALAAEKKFNENKPPIIGRITAIDKDIIGDPYVILQGTSALNHVQLMINENDPEILNANKGDVLQASCDTATSALGGVLARGCSIDKIYKMKTISN